MTENLLQKLEEKMMLLVAEIEDARKEISHLSQENTALRAEKEKHAKKLHELLSLLDVVNHEHVTAVVGGANLTAVKPMLMKETVVMG